MLPKGGEERAWGENMGLKRGVGHWCHGSRWRLCRPHRQILLGGKPHQHSRLRCNYYQRGREGGRKGPGCSEGLSVRCVLMASLIPENFWKPFLSGKSERSLAWAASLHVFDINKIVKAVLFLLKFLSIHQFTLNGKILTFYTHAQLFCGSYTKAVWFWKQYNYNCNSYVDLITVCWGHHVLKTKADRNETCKSVRQEKTISKNKV